MINSGLDKATGEYNYDSIFNYIAPYVQAADYAVANMEGELAAMKQEGADLLSTWVDRHDDAAYGREIFPIVPLDTQIADWTVFGLTDKTLPQAQASLERSNEVLAEGLQKANAFYAQKQAEHEAAIGVDTGSETAPAVG